VDVAVPNILNLAFEGVDGESLLMALRDIALSTGSACNSASVEPSYVLKGIGVPRALALASLRFSFGRFTTDSRHRPDARRPAARPVGAAPPGDLSHHLPIGIHRFQERDHGASHDHHRRRRPDRRVLDERGHGLGLRVSVKPSGCSGYSYVLDFADEAANDDVCFEEHGVQVFVAPMPWRCSTAARWTT
jgi:hypothetical protein